MSKTPRPSLAFDARRVALPLGIFLFALIFRLVGIGWGLPNDLRNWSLHPDEDVVYLYSQQIEPAKLDFDPGFYNYGTLYLTVLRVTSDVVQVYGGGTDRNNPASVIQGRRSAQLAGRVLGALSGAGFALVVVLILRRWTNDVGAGFGGGVAAIAPALVVHSRFLTVDLPATFLIGLSALFALRLLPKEGEESPPPAMKMAVLAGLFAGLSAGTKYTGILALLTLYVALAFAKPPRAAVLALAGTGAALLAFVVTTPGILTNTDKFLTDFLFEMRKSGVGQGLIFVGTGPTPLVHFGNLAIGVGLILVLMGFAGLGWGAAKKQPWIFALLAFFVIYAVVISRAEVKFLRYTFPLILALACGFGWLIGESHARGGRLRILVVLGILGLGGLDPGGLRGAATMTAWMATDDPRDAAARFLKRETEATPDAVVGLVSDAWYWSPSLFPDAPIPRMAPFPARQEAMAQARGPRVVRYIPPEGPDARFDWDERLLTEAKPEYVAFTSFESDDLNRLRGKPGLSPEVKLQTDRFDAFMRRLIAEYAPVRFFGEELPLPHDLEYIQPTVYVWKRKTAP